MRLQGGRLAALHCFLHCARQLSFARAAELLHLSPSAVSHRMRKLEEELGFPLFQRLPRGLVLTERGETLYQTLAQSLGQIDNVLAQLEQPGPRGQLRLHAVPGLAQGWLLPRLADFYQRYPGLGLSLVTGNAQVDFGASRWDGALYYLPAPPPGLTHDALMIETLIPVCSPDYLSTLGSGGLQQARLLHDASAWFGCRPEAEWQYWLERQTLSMGEQHLYFDQTELAVQAAQAGLGVAMGRGHLVAARLAAGTLIAPFGPAVAAPCRYWLSYPAEQKKAPVFGAFRDWLLAQSCSFSHCATRLEK